MTSYDRRTASESYALAVREATRLFNNLPYRRGMNRLAVLKAIVRAVVKNNIVMAEFTKRAQAKRFEHAVEDVLGKAIRVWKNENRIDQNPEFDELSKDPYLDQKLYEAAKGPSAFAAPVPASTIDYGQMSLLADNIARYLQQLKDGSTPNPMSLHDKATTLTEQLLKLLSK